MKINHLNNGDIVIVFSKNEIEHINNQKTDSIEDNFKSLHEKTRNFVIDLYNYFGYKQFKVNDKKVIELRRKHFIVDLSQLLRQLKDRNIVELIYKNNDNVKRKRVSIINFKSLQ